MELTSGDECVSFDTSATRGHDDSSVSSAALVELRRGAFVAAAAWEAAYAEARLRMRVCAVASTQRSALGVWSHCTAAACHGLPLYGLGSERVEMIVPTTTTRHGSSDVIRHQATLTEDDVVLIGGHRVTSLDRTVYDVIRSVSLAAAVVCFDAALHRVAWNERTLQYDTGAADEFRRAVRERIDAHAGARGIRQARFVVDFADGLSQSPGESVARLWMWQLGMPTPHLQYRVDFDGGGFALLDLCWPELRRWAEFDGEVKYTDPMLLAGRTRAEVVRAQEEREQRVAHITGWQCHRWGFEQMSSFTQFADFIRGIGLLP